ncbi:chalcone isomerase family protein [Pseudocolwellia sp. HL-MZ7]|uniref:chalcone isomerase family protein n=1 Tax=Pseudocolwellia sp. HL-MZ7 TaxID=3400627 RepID=UPI003CF9E425
MYTQKLFVFLLFSLFSVVSIAADTATSKDHDVESTLASSLQKLGEGQMNILFWKVYKADFYSADSPYNEKTYPKALKLTYQRDIEKQEFIDATQGEWVKLNANFSERLIPQVQEDKWLTQLSEIFPDIKEDDVILFTLSKEKQANFYLKAASNSESKSLDYQLLGSINEPTFGDYFLSIWLSEKTSEPKLRKKLIGQ